MVMLLELVLVLAVFSRRFHGEAAVIGLMRAAVPGLASFAVFFVVCALAFAGGPSLACGNSARAEFPWSSMDAAGVALRR